MNPENYLDFHIAPGTPLSDGPIVFPGSGGASGGTPGAEFDADGRAGGTDRDSDRHGDGDGDTHIDANAHRDTNGNAHTQGAEEDAHATGIALAFAFALEAADVGRIVQRHEREAAALAEVEARDRGVVDGEGPRRF